VTLGHKLCWVVLGILLSMNAHADGATIAQKGAGSAAACQSCHGVVGEGVAAAGFPRLASLGASYLQRQLEAFAEGTGSSAAMMPIAKALSAATPAGPSLLGQRAEHAGDIPRHRRIDVWPRCRQQGAGRHRRAAAVQIIESEVNFGMTRRVDRIDAQAADVRRWPINHAVVDARQAFEGRCSGLPVPSTSGVADHRDAIVPFRRV